LEKGTHNWSLVYPSMDSALSLRLWLGRRRRLSPVRLMLSTEPAGLPARRFSISGGGTLFTPPDCDAHSCLRGIFSLPPIPREAARPIRNQQN
jgi:hypothetical protein